MNAESTIHALIGSISYQDKCRILQNLIWDLFGEIDENGEGILVPTRVPDSVELASVVTSLRQEFWPNREESEEAEDVEDDAEEEDKDGDNDMYRRLVDEEDARGTSDEDE